MPYIVTEVPKHKWCTQSQTTGVTGSPSCYMTQPSEIPILSPVLFMHVGDPYIPPFFDLLVCIWKASFLYHNQITTTEQWNDNGTTHVHHIYCFIESNAYGTLLAVNFHSTKRFDDISLSLSHTRLYGNLQKYHFL